MHVESYSLNAISRHALSGALTYLARRCSFISCLAVGVSFAVAVDDVAVVDDVAAVVDAVRLSVSPMFAQSLQ